MSHVDFPVYDCDNHYYEALDAFSRHIEPEFRSRTLPTSGCGWASQAMLHRSTRKAAFPRPARAQLTQCDVADQPGLRLRMKRR